MIFRSDKITVDTRYVTVASRRDTNFQLYWQAASIGFAAQAILLVEITKSSPLAGAALSIASFAIGVSMVVLSRSQRIHQQIESAWLDFLESEAQSDDLLMLHDASVRDRARQVLSVMNRSAKRSELEELDSYHSIRGLATSTPGHFVDASSWFTRVQYVLILLSGFMLIWHTKQISCVQNFLHDLNHQFHHSHFHAQQKA